MELNGNPVAFPSQWKQKMPDRVIHQELNYVPSVSIAENIFIGNMPRFGRVDYKTMYSRSIESWER